MVYDYDADPYELARAKREEARAIEEAKRQRLARELQPRKREYSDYEKTQIGYEKGRVSAGDVQTRHMLDSKIADQREKAALKSRKAELKRLKAENRPAVIKALRKLALGSDVPSGVRPVRVSQPRERSAYGVIRDRIGRLSSAYSSVKSDPIGESWDSGMPNPGSTYLREYNFNDVGYYFNNMDINREFGFNDPFDSKSYRRKRYKRRRSGRKKHFSKKKYRRRY